MEEIKDEVKSKSALVRDRQRKKREQRTLMYIETIHRLMKEKKKIKKELWEIIMRNREYEKRKFIKKIKKFIENMEKNE
jgi:hypothetical protein